jgi:predicted aminopeptidase
MISNIGVSASRIALTVTLALSLSGCYYVQAARGQLELMQKREPIEELTMSAETPVALAHRLELVLAARQFSIDALGLPDNDSYRSYADLEREYVVWNVFAAPEFSLQAREWCFPVAGCVNYRGYFSVEAARKKARQLEEEGLDVTVGGVAAYSTLGRFADPVLNTMMRWDDLSLVATLFHELAHQVVYVKGDTGFNESFATLVEEVGVERWLEQNGEPTDLQRYKHRRELRERLMQIVAAGRDELEQLYATRLSAEEMRPRKVASLARLRQELADETAASGAKAPEWLAQPLNNARLASMTLYEGRVPELRELLDACGGDLRCFYTSARRRAQDD